MATSDLQIELPSSNTGVLPTNLIMDYLAFTVPYSPEFLSKLRKFFDETDIQKLDYGGMGYDHSAVFLDGGRIYWHSDHVEMGIHVRINSKSLGLVRATPLGIINRVRHWGGKFTRVDLAFDDMMGLLDVDRLYEKLRSGECVTRWRKVIRVVGGELGDDKKMGDTLNVGSRSSNSYLRIYDKRLEQGVETCKQNGIGHWVRVELELKKDKADVVCKMLGDTAINIEPGKCGLIASRLLLGLLDFKEPNQEDTNKSRWETSDFWKLFIGSCSKLKLSIPKKVKTLEDSKKWVRSSVAPTLAMIVLADSDDDDETGYEFIIKTMLEGQSRLSKMQINMLEAHNSEVKASRERIILEKKQERKLPR